MKKTYFFTILIGVTLTIIYTKTLLPGIGYHGDATKFQFVGKILGTAHPTGFPTYILLNHLFTNLFPFGSLAWKANFLSAIFSIMSVILLMYLLRRLNINPIISFFTALIFGLSLTLWSQSLIAEVYTLNALFIITIIYLLILWKQNKYNLHLFLAMSLYAIALGNHPTMIWMFPGIIIFILLTNKKILLNKSFYLTITIALIIILSLYAYSFWRLFAKSVYLEMNTPNLSRFWWYITGAQFKHKMFAFDMIEIITDRIPLFLKLLGKNLYFLIIPAIYGLFAIKDKTLHLLLIVTCAINLFYALNYDIEEIFVYFMPVYLILFIYAAIAIQQLTWPKYIITSLLMLTVFFFIGINFKQVDQLNNTREAQQIENILKIVKNNSVIVTPSYHYSEFFWYYLLGKQIQNIRNIYVIHSSPPVKTIQAYLQNDNSYFQGQVNQPTNVPIGLKVYIVLYDPDYKQSLDNLGIKLYGLGDPDLHLFEIL